jgi:cobyric acid synthase
MKTEEILRYEEEFKVMEEALGTSLLVFGFPGGYSIFGDQIVDANEKRERREIKGKTMSQA